MSGPEARATAARYLREMTPADEWMAVIEPEVAPELARLIRGWIEASERGDLDYLVAGTHPEAVISQPTGIPDAKTYRGQGAVVEALNDWPSQWEEFRVEPRRIWQARPGRLMLRSTHRGRGAESGIEIEADVWWLMDFRDGLMHRWQMFFDEAEAEAALVDQD